MPGTISEVSQVGPEGPRCTIQHINNCKFSAWNEKYRRLCPKTRIIRPLPQEFIEYLNEDGIVLPGDSLPAETEIMEIESGDDEDTATEGAETANLTESTKKDSFPELLTQIEEIIQELGNSVSPKLNWSSPRDAKWMSPTNNLMCNTPNEIFMLLKASDYITHDLSEAYSQCIDFDQQVVDANPECQTFELVLRKWFDINPAVEFRCFVKDRHLVGITQRDMNYYEYLPALKERIQQAIEKAFEEHIQQTFPDPNFVFDVYVPSPYTKAWLIDINPFAGKTDTLLFDWEEIIAFNPFDESFQTEFRLVDSVDSSRGFGSVEHTENAVPREFIDASINPGQYGGFIGQLRELIRQQEQEARASDDC